MAQYTVIQDVEADDKLLGPLSLKQFIFAGIGAVCVYLSFFAVSKGFWPALILFLPLIFASGLLAFPWRKEQPTEIWLAARIRFMLQPRRRIWNQIGLKDLVTITVPKVVEKHLVKDFSGEEAQSRLSALANVLDSRGWAVKNSNVNVSSEPVSQPVQASSDRLLDASQFATETQETEIKASDDIMDATSNAVAQNFDRMIQSSEHKHREELQEKIAKAREKNFGKDNVAAADAWFAEHGHVNKPVNLTPGYVFGGGGATIQPEHATTQTTGHHSLVPHTTAAERDEELAKRIREGQERANQSVAFAHLKTIQPLGAKGSEAKAEKRAETKAPVPPAQAPLTSLPPVKPAIMQLAVDNDKNVATLAREAKRDDDQHLPENEVVIPLH